MTLSPAMLRLREGLVAHQPRRRFTRHATRRASVAVVLRDAGQGVETLMIQRTHRSGDPWSGHMAFPGGMRERCDYNLRQTALRELREEVGLRQHNLRYLGRLSELSSHTHRLRGRMVVHPYVFMLTQPVIIRLEPSEAQDYLWVPLDYMADHDNRRTMSWVWKGRRLQLPCYDVDGKRIWGLSLQMIDELMQVGRIWGGGKQSRAAK